MREDNGRETASNRAARKWSTKRSRAAADLNGNGGGASSDFWHSSAEEKAYLAGFLAGTAYAQVSAEKDFEQGYSEAAARFGKRKADSR